MTKQQNKAVGKLRTKSDVFTGLAKAAGITRKQVAAVFGELAGMIRKDLGKGPGAFAIPGLLKITAVRKPATRATTRPDPFHPGQIMTVKAKPARKVVKLRALKALKTMV